MPEQNGHSATVQASGNKDEQSSWPRWIEFPRQATDGEASYTLLNAHVPQCLLRGAEKGIVTERDGLVTVDIEVARGVVGAIRRAGSTSPSGLTVDLEGGMVLPTFADLHTHIDKGHTCERSRNPSGSLHGADKSVGADEAHWDRAELRKRMEFSLRSAYAHGTSALRTHLMSGDVQGAMTWPVFAELRDEWKGKVELQGVSLAPLCVFRDEAKAEGLADLVKKHGGVFGAAVSCTDRGGLEGEEFTTCGEDMPRLLDYVFRLAAERGLDLDFHVDENCNEESKGLRYIAEASMRCTAFTGKVVCGHCCSLAAQSQADMDATLTAAKDAGITVVSLPLVNLWLQNRDVEGRKTPWRRGCTRLLEVAAAGVDIAIASDNTRDQFYGYGDLDMLEVFRESVRIGHLDRPIDRWPLAVTHVPAAAMGLGDSHGLVAAGRAADLVVFRGRVFSELLSRPQFDRVVLRGGRPLTVAPPDYRELDEVAAAPGETRTQTATGRQKRRAGWAAAELNGNGKAELNGGVNGHKHARK